MKSNREKVPAFEVGTSEEHGMLALDDCLDRIFCADSLEFMRRLPDASIDLVVTSPPYNLKNSTGNGLSKSTKSGKWSRAAIKNGYSHYNDCMPHDEYAAWQRECLREMYRVIKDDGAIFYNHKWRVQKGLMQDRNDIVGTFPVRQIIIWRRKGGINFNPGYFLPTYEVIYLIAKSDFALIPEAKAYGDLWEFAQEMKNPHPAPFPVALIDRIMKSTSGRVVLDPFMGSGTTAVVATAHGRHYIGADISPVYCRYARMRIARNRIESELKSIGPDFPELDIAR
ncbi:DNA-methyltransferase [Paraprevotella clara]|uniref:DNA-methyltransferase n=1 Tax=Paraprevotella clara TaxID=454154 RepID=UPI003FF1303B